jgi:phosphatidylinositol dimannoside acyltransferase
MEKVCHELDPFYMSRDVMHQSPLMRRLVFHCGIQLARRIPLSLGRLIAYLIGLISWACDVRGRKVVYRNLAHFIPSQCPDAIHRCVRRNYILFFLYLYETFRCDILPERYFRTPKLTLHDPFNVMKRAPLQGAAILVTVHSHWELVPFLINNFGISKNISIISLSSGDPEIDAIFDRLRKKSHNHSLDLKAAPLGSLRALKAEGQVGIVADRDYTGNGIPFRFAGENMLLPLGPAALAVQTQAPIIPFFLARSGLTRLHFIIGKPIIADPRKTKQEEVQRIMHELATWMARSIASAPANWVAFHPAWGRE